MGHESPGDGVFIEQWLVLIAYVSVATHALNQCFNLFYGLVVFHDVPQVVVGL